jgi:glycosyltransferase involved in cell wall biosynthesis
MNIVVFDDASSDKSVQYALKAGATVHMNRTNHGLGNNFNIIVTHAIAGNYDYLLTVDADGQFPPTEVRKVLVSALGSDSDVTLGSRFLNKELSQEVPKSRTKGNKVVRGIIKVISGKKVSDATCGLRVYSRNGYLTLHPTEKFSYTVESMTQLLLANMKILEVPIRVRYFEGRNSTISGSLYRYGRKTIGITSRLALSFALSRLLRKSTWLMFSGAIIQLLFFYVSAVTGRFRGNLCLATSGAIVFFIGLASFFFYVISLKLDHNLKINLITQKLLISKTSECVDCIKSE